MGLDMYLTKRTYVKNWDFMAPEERHTITITKGGQPVPFIRPERISNIVEEVGYWRKANAIHAWFVANCQDGRDECQETFVEVSKLEELLDIVRRVRADNSLAPDLLPSQEGFFFGSTDYDEYYFQDLKETEDILIDALSDTDADFYYHSSW